jgi:glycosyltransferase involved in cell wall biosynthesis
MKRNLRVLIAASIYPPDPGGPAVHAKKQYEWFRERGISVQLVALAWFRFLPKGISHICYFLFLLVKGIASNIIYAHDALGAGTPASWAAKFLREKLVIRIGGDIPWEREVGESGVSMLEWYESGAHRENKFFIHSRKVMQKADKIIVTSPLLEKVYARYYDVPAGKVAVISNPVPELSATFSETEPNIIFASRLVSYKNLDTAIKAFAKVSRNHQDLKLILMGDGPEDERLKKLVQELGVKEKVVFKGKVSQDQVLKETSRALFTLAPAVTEFNPNYVLQGVALKKPFLISSGHGLPFEVPGFLTFNHRDEKELEEKISYLLNPDGYKKAKEFVASLDFKMSWEENLKANLKVLSEVLNGSK